IERSNQMANYFAANGLQKGDRIIIMLPRCLEAYTSYMGALKLGLIIIPCSDQLRVKDIDYRIQHSEAKAIVFDERFEEQIQPSISFDTIKKFMVGTSERAESLRTQLDAQSTTFEKQMIKRDDVAFISYTSGTTGTPK